MMRALSRTLVLLALCLGSACSFEAPAGEAALTTNSCTVNEDCLDDSVCNGTMCVARAVNDSLRVYLHMQPLQPPDGPTPVAITSKPFTVDRGSDVHKWALPEPVRFRGTIRNAGVVVDADVTLTASQELPGLPKVVVMASVAGGSSKEDPELDFDMRLPQEGEYTLRVQPKDTTLPPYEQVLEVKRGDTFDIDYDMLMFERTIALSREGEGRKLVVRAFDLATGALISSTVEVSANVEEAEMRATLRFASEPSEFRLVVRAEDAYDNDGLSTDGPCDHDTPVLPTFSINSSALAEDEDGVLQVNLPAAPPRVRLEGWVEACGAASPEGVAEPETYPVTLRSTAVTLDEADTMWTAEVATDTVAAQDGAMFRYCVDVFQGTYEVVVTPPESKPCEIFAERGVLISSQDGVKATGPTFTMKEVAELTGELRTLDMMPLVATTVDVQSLGRALDLSVDDAAITAFNRSRQTTTDASGGFRVAVDRGGYDVTIKPPSGSGYAWYVRRDVEIASNDRFTNNVDMSSPVAVDCDINYPDDSGESVMGAEITAYAVITDPELGDRAIAVGQATADENGNFMLLLPSEILSGWLEAGRTE